MKPLRFILLALGALGAFWAFAADPAKTRSAKGPPPPPKPAITGDTFVAAAAHGHLRRAINTAIETLQNEAKPGDDYIEPKLFIAACQWADAKQVVALKEVLKKFSDDDVDICVLYSAYVRARFRVVAKQLAESHTEIALPPLNVRIPADVASDPDAQRAWVAWHRATEPYNALAAMAKARAPAPAPAVVDPNSATAAVAQANSAIQHTLSAPGKSSLSPLYTIFDHQVIDDDPIYGKIPLTRGLLLSLLDGGLPAEALGAALLQPNSNDDAYFEDRSRSLPAPIPYDDSLRQYLAACGLDWEEVYAGAMFTWSSEPDPREADGVKAVYSWKTLAQHGSPRGIRTALAVIRVAKIPTEYGLNFLLDVLDSEPVRDPRPGEQKSAAELRRDVMDAIQWYLSPDRADLELCQTLNLIPASFIPEIRPALHRLLQGPSYPLSLKVKDMLSHDVVPIGSLPAMARPSPLRIRVLENGRPVAHTYFYADFPGNQQSGAETDGDGWASIPVELIYDLPKANFAYLYTIGNEPVKDGHWPGPWFYFSVPIKGELHREHTANVSTASLEITLDPHAQGYLPEAAKLDLSRSPQVGNGDVGSEGQLSLAVTDSITLERVQVGNYRATITADGAAVLRPKPIDLGTKGASRLYRLEPGHEVRFSVALPGDPSPPGRWGCAIFQDGQPVDFPDNLSHTGQAALPAGKFQVRLTWVKLWGSDTIRALASFPPEGLLDSQIESSGTWTYDFEIKPDSPAIVDLGQIPWKMGKDGANAGK